MKQMTVISGKGGTGKTTLTASFAALAKGNVVIADCDVDAATLHLLLKPRVVASQEFKGSKVAVINMDKCTKCLKCEEACRFHAIKDLQVDPILCEGCGVCKYVCPEAAIIFDAKISGFAFVSETRYGPMSHARLEVAEENSGKLVTIVRRNAKQMAEEKGKNLILIDGPPGISCPVIASITDVNLALIVTEPTKSGIHDLERVLHITNHFKIPSLVCINMYDINMENTEKITELCENRKIDVIGKIPFNPIVTKAMVAGQTVVDYSSNGDVTEKIKEIWSETLARLQLM